MATQEDKENRENTKKLRNICKTYQLVSGKTVKATAYKIFDDL